MSVQIEEIRAAVRALDVAGRPVVVHASLRSFGHVHGGANTVVEGLLAERCTVLVPTFSEVYAVASLPHQRLARNGYDYARLPLTMPGTDRVFTLTRRNSTATAWAPCRPPCWSNRDAGAAIIRSDAVGRLRAAASARRAGRHRHPDGRRA